MRRAARTTVGVYGIVLALGLAHLGGITRSALQRDPFVYDFRLYSLLLVGVLMVAPSAMALARVRRLAAGDPAAWRRVRVLTLVVLAVNLPLVPTELGYFPFVPRAEAGGMLAFGSLVSALAAVEWIVLARSRVRLR